MREAIFESETLPFEPGGALVLYTDGLIETPRPPDPIFTPDSLRTLLSAFPGGNAAELRNKITSALFFEPAPEVDDDLTMIVAMHTDMNVEPCMDYEI